MLVTYEPLVTRTYTPNARDKYIASHSNRAFKSNDIQLQNTPARRVTQRTTYPHFWNTTNDENSYFCTLIIYNENKLFAPPPSTSPEDYAKE